MESNKNYSGPYKDAHQILTINRTEKTDNLKPLKIKREGVKSSVNLKREKLFQLPGMDLTKYCNSQMQSSQLSINKYKNGKQKSIDGK